MQCTIRDVKKFFSIFECFKIKYVDDCEEQARDFLNSIYEKDHRELDELMNQKQWEYQTNINEETSAAAVSLFVLL